MNGMAAADEETTYFLMDTNFFRYTHSADTSHQIAALDFLVEARKEIERGTAVIVISDKVKCELEVQKHTLSQYKYLATISGIRNSRDVFTVKPYKHDYLRTSDARILVDAYMNDAILVTNNIKDFIVYTLFLEPGANKLYDFMNKRYVEISQNARDRIAVDPLFLSIASKLESLQVT